jgi:signal transduction histidine kinase
MSLRITLVFVCTCIYAYFHNIDIYDTETLDYTEKYAVAQADRESDYFLTAESNVNIMEKDFVRKMALITDEQAKSRFDSMMAQEKDTVWRAQGAYADYKNLATMAILPTAKFDGTFYKTIVTSLDIVSQYGPAFRNRYYDTYLNMFGNDANALYLPEADYSRLTGIKELMVDYDSETGGSPKLNPTRSVFWTSIYFDEAVKKWMLSVTKPVDYNGQWIGGVGHDLLIDDTIKRSEDVSIPGSYNLVFSKKGDLIAYKDLKTEIEKNGGQLELSKITDPKINAIWNAVSKLDKNGASIKSNDAQAYIAVKKIAGPEWIFVKVLPIPFIMVKAKSSIITVIFITLIALIIELTIIYRILRKDVGEPLSDLILATQHIYENPHIEKIPTSRNDELGTLANSFKNMASKVSENKKILEIKVHERTTELVASNNLLVENNNALDKINKQKNEFIAIASHDLKNPLSMILLSVNLIKRKMENAENEKLIEKLNVIEGQSKRMMEIIGDYLNYTLTEESRENPTKEKFDLTEYLNFILEQNSEVLNNKLIHLSKKLDPAVILNSNKNICGHIIENLLSNAVKFSETGKEITVELYQSEKSIFLRISDEGQGIPKEEQHLVFQKYAKLSTKPTQGETSTGLGLSIVKQLVDKIGAKISFESTPLLGTKFLIEFPKI